MTEKKEMIKSNGRTDIRSLIMSDAMKDQFALALPRSITPDRMVRVALTALHKTPKLLSCTQESLLSALMTCAELGLEPDGRRVHLIPYGNVCQLIIDYKGLVELAMRTGKVSNIHADVVCENDVFEYDLGEIKTHKIDFRKPRGEVYAAYALVRFKDGTAKAEVMSKNEIDRIKDRSKAGKSGPWVTDWSEMAKKTAFRRLSKWLQLSPEHQELLDRDADSFPSLQYHAEPAITVHAATAVPEAPMIPERNGEIDRLIEEGIKIIGQEAFDEICPGADYRLLDDAAKQKIVQAISRNADEMAEGGSDE
jgi:recombination protein RecT